MKYTVLEASFFDQSTDSVAQQLLGMLLIRVIDGTVLVGKIVETESYTYNDPASHCYQKKTARNKALFGPVGHAYVYKIYGIHYGFNVVAHSQADIAGGVLIRAVEPLLGIEHMQVMRGDVPHVALTNGPGKLTQAFSIDTRFYGRNLMEKGELFIAQQEQRSPVLIHATPRIGISKAQDLKKRFIIKNNRWVTPHLFNK